MTESVKNLRKCRFWLSFTLVLSPLALAAQSSYLPLNEDYYHWIDRYEVKAGRVLPQLFTTIKPYKRSAVIDFIDSLNGRQVFTSRTDEFNYNYLRNDSWEWSRSEVSDS
ncbi:MAG: hypothetical protein HC859_14455 [Bacteroidia bacterium]|nr:hypothetical protein [Bacteroidia bacterium]